MIKRYRASVAPCNTPANLEIVNQKKKKEKQLKVDHTVKLKESEK